MKALPLLILLTACNQVFGLEEPIEADANRVDAMRDAQLDASIDVPVDAAIDSPSPDACVQYALSGQAQTWIFASADCTMQGRQLVRIDGLAENAVVQSLASSSIHIGLHRVNGNFVWEDGVLPIFTNWAPSQPSGEDCVMMALDGFWFDVDCGSVNNYVCECAP